MTHKNIIYNKRFGQVEAFLLRRRSTVTLIMAVMEWNFQIFSTSLCGIASNYSRWALVIIIYCYIHEVRRQSSEKAGNKFKCFLRLKHLRAFISPRFNSHLLNAKIKRTKNGKCNSKTLLFSWKFRRFVCFSKATQYEAENKFIWNRTD